MTAERLAGDIEGMPEIAEDFVEPCGYCGIPCTGTFRLRHADEGNRRTFEVDRPTLSELLDSLVGVAIEEKTYDALPAFVRSWNESTGWADAGFDEWTRLDGEDLLATVRALMAQNTDTGPRIPDLLRALERFVSRCVAAGGELWGGET